MCIGGRDGGLAALWLAGDGGRTSVATTSSASVANAAGPVSGALLPPRPPPTCRTPCLQRVYDALPPESRTGRVQLLIPAKMRPFHPLLQPGQDPLLQPPPAGSSGSTNSSGTGGDWQHAQHLQQQQPSFMPYGEWKGDSAGAAAAADAFHRQGGAGTAAAAAAVAAARSTADAPACVVHLAATGDQTFGRRLRLGFPLLKDVRAEGLRGG